MHNSKATKFAGNVGGASGEKYIANITMKNDKLVTCL